MQDLASQPLYTIAEAARYAAISAPSVTRWRAGYSYATRRGVGHSAPVTGGRPAGLLTFDELLEVAVVAAARHANVPMSAIRAAVETAKGLYRVDRPLALLKFKHAGREIFVHELESGDYVNLSRRGQVAWEHIRDVLEDLDYEDDRAARWWPRGRGEPIVIDPRISFGRPYIIRKGISTDAVRSRWLAKEPLFSIAEDFDLTEAEAEAALRFEYPAAA
jgi:uncharacterized protein (DUF433 family)